MAAAVLRPGVGPAPPSGPPWTPPRSRCWRPSRRPGCCPADRARFVSLCLSAFGIAGPRRGSRCRQQRISAAGLQQALREPAMLYPSPREEAGVSDRSGQSRQGPAGVPAGRLWAAADVRRVPLRTIIAAIVAVAVFYLGAQLIYRLREIFLIILVAGFLALLLNPVAHLLRAVPGQAARVRGGDRGRADDRGVPRAVRRVRLPAGQRDHPPGQQPAHLRLQRRERQGLAGQAGQALPRADLDPAERVQAGLVRRRTSPRPRCRSARARCRWSSSWSPSSSWC